MANPIVTRIDVLEGVQKVDAVLIALEDGLLFIPPGGDVVHPVRDHNYLN